MGNSNKRFPAFAKVSNFVAGKKQKSLLTPSAKINFADCAPRPAKNKPSLQLTFVAKCCSFFFLFMHPVYSLFPI